jgi:hypothetical protein
LRSRWWRSSCELFTKRSGSPSSSKVGGDRGAPVVDEVGAAHRGRVRGSRGAAVDPELVALAPAYDRFWRQTDVAQVLVERRVAHVAPHEDARLVLRGQRRRGDVRQYQVSASPAPAAT